MNIIKLPQGSRYQGLPAISSNHLRPPKTLGRVFFCQKMDMIHFLRGNPTILAQHLKFL